MIVKKYLIDVNLPRYFSLWAGEEYEHVVNIDDEMQDSEVWQYAKENNLTIVTKDADFSELMLLNEPPPRVIHITAKGHSYKVRKYKNEAVPSGVVKSMERYLFFKQTIQTS